MRVIQAILVLIISAIVNSAGFYYKLSTALSTSKTGTNDFIVSTNVEDAPSTSLMYTIAATFKGDYYTAKLETLSGVRTATQLSTGVLCSPFFTNLCSAFNLVAIEGTTYFLATTDTVVNLLKISLVASTLTIPVFRNVNPSGGAFYTSFALDLIPGTSTKFVIPCDVYGMCFYDYTTMTGSIKATSIQFNSVSCGTSTICIASTCSGPFSPYTLYSFNPTLTAITYTMGGGISFSGIFKPQFTCSKTLDLIFVMELSKVNVLRLSSMNTVEGTTAGTAQYPIQDAICTSSECQLFFGADNIFAG